MSRTAVNNINVFYSIYIRAQIVKIQENTNKCTILQYKVFTTNSLQLRHVLTFAGHPQVVYINICT
jgi:hypothetical protein